jgi:hypothetical protein
MQLVRRRSMPQLACTVRCDTVQGQSYEWDDICQWGEQNRETALHVYVFYTLHTVS